MPIWTELVFLLLGFYVFGLGLGWLFWGRGDFTGPTGTTPTDSIESDDT